MGSPLAPFLLSWTIRPLKGGPASVQRGKYPSLYFSFDDFASTLSGLQEQAKPWLPQLSGSKGGLMQRSSHSPSSRFVWERLSLGKVFPGLVCALVKFWTKGPKELTDGNAQDSHGVPFFRRESLEHGPGTSIRRRKIHHLAQGKLGSENTTQNPSFRVRCAVTSAKALERLWQEGKRA